MIPRFRARIGVRELLSALAITDRGAVSRYEAVFAEMAGQRYAIAFPYGRTALVLLFEALGLFRRKVVVPAYTCVVVPHAVLYASNQPVFVDSQEEDANMDLDLAEQFVAAGASSLVATSIFGHPVDLDRLDALQRKHPDLLVIQDCAHSWFAEWHGRPVQRHGIAAVYGSNISKLCTSIFGGMVTTDNDELARRLRSLRDRRLRASGAVRSLRHLAYLYASTIAFSPVMYGAVIRLQQSGLLDRFVRYYDEGQIDMPADWLEGMSASAARTGIEQLHRWPEIVDTRRNAARFLRERFKDVPGLRLPPDRPGATWSHFAVRHERRDELAAYLLKQGVETGRIVDYVIPEFPAYRALACNSTPEARFPVATTWRDEVLNLPVWDERPGTLRRIVQLVHTFAGV